MTEYDDFNNEQNGADAAENEGFSGEPEFDEDAAPIIDVHAHIGHWSADNVDFTQDVLEEAFNEPFDVQIGDGVQKNEVRYVLVSNMNGIDTLPDSTPTEDEIECNEKMLNICATNPKFKAMIIGQPGHGDAANLAGILDECYDDVFGLKLHPNTLLLNANDPLYEPYMEVAGEYGLPVLFHSQDKWSAPEYIYETAQKFPEVPTVLAHMGMGDEQNHYVTLGLIKGALLSETANLYADVSWLSPEVIVYLLGTTDEEMRSHFMWGTDIPLGPFGDPSYYPNRVAEVKNAIYESFGDEAEDLIYRLFYQNAYDLFFKRRFEEE